MIFGVGITMLKMDRGKLFQIRYTFENSQISLYSQDDMADKT